MSVEKLGKLLHEGWLLKKSLSSNITTSKIDQAYDIALESGAFGGKLSGAGSGGFLSVIAAKENHEKIIKKMTQTGLVFFKFKKSPNGARVTVLQ